MNDDIVNTIEVLVAKVRGKEDEANKLKHLVNELCSEACVAIRYPNVAQNGGVSLAIRADHFYGQTLTAAIRNYLEHRKASGLGAATVVEIFRAIRDGGYKFESRSEQNKQISVGNALRKTSSIFHRLPNGQYGLLAWYPSAKAVPENDAPNAKWKGKGKHPVKKAATGGAPGKTPAAQITNKEIREVILSQAGEFQAIDIETAVKAKFPSKEIPKTKIASVLFISKNKGLLREVSARTGKKGAVYAKI